MDSKIRTVYNNENADVKIDASIVFEAADETKYLSQLFYSIKALREHEHTVSGDTIKVGFLCQTRQRRRLMPSARCSILHLR